MIPHQTHPHPPLTRTSGYVNMLPPRCSRQRDSLHPHSQPDRIEHVTLPAIIIKRTRHRPMYPDPDLTGRRSETSHHHHASTMRRDGTSSCHRIATATTATAVSADKWLQLTGGWCDGPPGAIGPPSAE